MQKQHEEAVKEPFTQKSTHHLHTPTLLPAEDSTFVSTEQASELSLL